QEPQVAFLDQVTQRQSAIQVTPRHLDDEPQVGLDYALLGRFVAGLDASGELRFIFAGQQRDVAYLAQVDGEVGSTGVARVLVLVTVLDLQQRLQRLVGDTLLRLSHALPRSRRSP